MENITNLIKAAEILTAYNNEEAAKLRAQRIEHEKTHCVECGREITEWDTTELLEDELILSYNCPCGCVADQHYRLVYTGTETF